MSRSGKKGRANRTEFKVVAIFLAIFFLILISSQFNEQKACSVENAIPNGNDPSPIRTMVPAQVAELTITPFPTGNALNLQWDNLSVSDPTVAGYNIYRHIASGFNASPLYYRDSTLNLFYNDTGLTNNVTYYYLVTAYDNGSIEGPASSEVNGTPMDIIAPPAITSLTVTVIPTGSTLNITWNLVSASDMLEYRVYRSLIPGFTPGPANLIASIPHPTIFYLDTGLIDGQSYYYKVLSVDDDGNYLPAVVQRSGISNDTIPPAQPANFTVTNINGSLLLNWTQATELDFVQYEVWRNGSSWVMIAQIVDIHQNWYFDDSDNLFDTYTYFYELRVYDEVGYDVMSPPKLTLPISPSGDIKPPQNVTDLSAQPWGFGGYVRLSWTAPASADIVYFKVFRSFVSGFLPNSSNQIGTVTATTGNNYYYDLDDSLDGSGFTTYYYQVRAVDDCNNTATGCNEIPFTPYDNIRPNPPLTFKASSLPDGSIRLTWTASTPPDFTAYYIYYESGIYPDFPVGPDNLVAMISNNNTLTHVDNESNLHLGSWYTYKIFIADEVGYKNEFLYAYNQSKNDTIAPSAPTGLNVTNEGTGDILDLMWTPNPELDVDHYDLYRNDTYVATINGRATTFYQDTGLTEYYTYVYYLRAVDDANNIGLPSSASNGVPVDIKAPGAPGIVLSVLPPSQIFLIITTPADLDTTYYYIYRWNGSWEAWTGNISDYQLVNNVSKTSSPQFWIETVLSPGNYSYLVTAVDEKLQEGPPSNIQNISLILLPPDLYNITSNINGDVTLNWSRNQNVSPMSIDKYAIYRMNSSATIPVFIGFVPYADYLYIAGSPAVEHYSYTDYGVPNGNWTYFIKVVNLNNVTSFYSNPLWVVINDTCGPGTPIFDRIEYSTLYWTRPDDTNYGADVLRYEIYTTLPYIINVPGVSPNGTLWGEIDPNGTILEYPPTNYTFGELCDGFWHFIIIAFDELGNPSDYFRFNWTIDTTPPTIVPESITDLTGMNIFAGQALRITVNACDAVGIKQVWLNYTINGITQPPIAMELVFINPNNTIYSIFSGSFTGFLAGQTINYSITVFDFYGHSATSASFTFTVLEKVFFWVYILLLIVIGGTCGAAIVLYRRLRAATPKISVKSKENEGSQEKSSPLKATIILHGKKILRLFNWKKK